MAGMRQKLEKVLLSSKKNLLRKRMKEQLKNTPVEEFRLQGEMAASLLCKAKIWSCFSVILIFLSMEGEVDTEPLIEAALGEGKKVFVPLVNGESLEFFRIYSSKGPWAISRFGIREPLDLEPDKILKKNKFDNENFPALIISPGLAFDLNGKRLGRGRGFYDRFFAELDSEEKKYFPLGLCMDFQLVENVPMEENDRKMDAVLTGTSLTDIIQTDFFCKEEKNGKN